MSRPPYSSERFSCPLFRRMHWATPKCESQESLSAAPRAEASRLGNIGIVTRDHGTPRNGPGTGSSENGHREELLETFTVEVSEVEGHFLPPLQRDTKDSEDRMRQWTMPTRFRLIGARSAATRILVAKKLI